MMSDAFTEVKDELTRARVKFPPFRSPHEGYAIIEEELDELWEEVKKQHHVRDNAEMRKEACQVAAMALRFMIDLTEEEK
jgi:glutamyl-tRNA reductase